MKSAITTHSHNSWMLWHINTALNQLPSVFFSFGFVEGALYASFSQFWYHKCPYVFRFTTRWVVDYCNGFLREASLSHLNRLSSLLYDLANLLLVLIQFRIILSALILGWFYETCAIRTLNISEVLTRTVGIWAIEHLIRQEGRAIIE